MTDDLCEQMAFSFFKEIEADKKTPAAERDFDTEDDALFALLESREDEQQLPPGETPSGEQFFSAPEPGTAEETDAEIDAAVDQFIANLDAEFAINTATDDLVKEIADTVAEVEAEEDEAVEETVVTVRKKNAFPELTEQHLRRAALGFLATMNPESLGMNFPSGIARIKVDAGAFFFGPGRTPVVDRTIAVVTCIDRNKCWIDASLKADLLAMLTQAQAEKMALEEELKVREPDLKDDSLFPESQIWDFSRARSRKYKSCLKKIERLEYSIYHGSKFERMMFEQLADEFYLIVPTGLITAAELPEEWGLVYVAEDFSATVIREAKRCDCPPEKRTAFALRAAATGCGDLLFANGISITKDGTARFHLPPKRRKAYC